MIHNQTPALLYHKVDTQWEIGVTRIRPKIFKQQMMTLKDAGWETILPGEENTVPPISEGSKSKGGASIKRFYLIFDDGYEGIYHHAFPLLEEIGYKASVFIPSGYIGKDNTWDYHFFGRSFRHMNRQMLRDLTKSGWLIGSHGISHTNLLGLDNKQLRKDLFVSREILSETIKSEVGWISFPFGRYGTREIEIAIEVGYKGAVVPAERKSAKVLNGFQTIIADAVYCWDPTGIIPGRLERRKGYGAGRLFRTVTNKCSYGTVIWKRLFGRNNPPEPLAADD